MLLITYLYVVVKDLLKNFISGAFQLATVQSKKRIGPHEYILFIPQSTNILTMESFTWLLLLSKFEKTKSHFAGVMQIYSTHFAGKSNKKLMTKPFHGTHKFNQESHTSIPDFLFFSRNQFKTHSQLHQSKNVQQKRTSTQTSIYE